MKIPFLTLVSITPRYKLVFGIVFILTPSQVILLLRADRNGTVLFKIELTSSQLGAGKFRKFPFREKLHTYVR